MDDALYTAMTGAQQLLDAQAVLANNLANVNTTGFQQDLAYFSSVAVIGDGFESRVMAVAETPATLFKPGMINNTGRDLDIAIQDQGWIAVQTVDGSEAYTRAGELRISPEGLLMTAKGDFVLGTGGLIAVPPAESLEIAGDGTISLRPQGQDANSLVQLDRIKLVNPPYQSIRKGTDGLFRSIDSNIPIVSDGQVRIVSRAIESSNVNAVETMVNMIELSRNFEMQIKIMQQAENNDKEAAQIMQL